MLILIELKFFFFTFKKEIMMDHSLRSISYIADIGDLVVLMAKRRNFNNQDNNCAIKRQQKLICHVFESEEVSVWIN